MENEAAFIKNLRGELRKAMDDMKAISGRKDGFQMAIDAAIAAGTVKAIGAVLRAYDQAQKKL